MLSVRNARESDGHSPVCEPLSGGHPGPETASGHPWESRQSDSKDQGLGGCDYGSVPSGSGEPSEGRGDLDSAAVLGGSTAHCVTWNTLLSTFW
jgi:hypothetical protein